MLVPPVAEALKPVTKRGLPAFQARPALCVLKRRGAVERRHLDLLDEVIPSHGRPCFA